MSNEKLYIWDMIQLIQYHVREKVEAQYPHMRVSEIRGNLTSRYVQPVHPLGEDPDYIHNSTVAIFHLILDYKDPLTRGGMCCTALLGVDGRIEISSFTLDVSRE